MNEATANTILLLFAVALIVFTGFMLKRRFFSSSRQAPLPVVPNQNLHVPWLKGGLILILFVALFTVAIYLSNFTKADWEGTFSKFPERTESYVFLGLGIAIIMIGTLWTKQNTTNDKKGH